MYYNLNLYTIYSVSSQSKDLTRAFGEPIGASSIGQDTIAASKEQSASKKRPHGIAIFT